MRSKRPIVINNCLVHGICNFNCITCTVNKPFYKGPREYQKPEVFKKVLDRIAEAAKDNIRVSYLALSGDGEPTLHPEFGKIIDIIGDFRRDWKIPGVPLPEIAVVSNGRALRERNILKILEGKNVGLKISFPTIHPRHYGEIMMMDTKDAEMIQKTVLENIASACALYAERKLPKLEIHLSPPFAPYVHEEMEQTIEYLAGIAKDKKLPQLNFILFPMLTNRGGVLQITDRKMNDYRSIFRKYHRKYCQGVLIDLKMSWKNFYRNIFDLYDLLKSFKYPCIWDGNFFITAGGDSCCCNDQSVMEKEGNIMRDSIRTLLGVKENRLRSTICRGCNQAPEQMQGGLYLGFHRFYTKLKMAKHGFKFGGSDIH